MALNRPTLTTITTRIITDFETRIADVGSLLRRSVLRVMAIVYAGAIHSLWGYIEYICKQVFVTTAESDYLDLLGGEYGLIRGAPTKAEGWVYLNGNTVGTIIPAGTELQSVDGYKYVTKEEYEWGTDFYGEVESVTAAAYNNIPLTTGSKASGWIYLNCSVLGTIIPISTELQNSAGYKYITKATYEWGVDYYGEVESVTEADYNNIVLSTGTKSIGEAWMNGSVGGIAIASGTTLKGSINGRWYVTHGAWSSGDLQIVLQSKYTGVATNAYTGSSPLYPGYLEPIYFDPPIAGLAEPLTPCFMPLYGYSIEGIIGGTGEEVDLTLTTPIAGTNSTMQVTREVPNPIGILGGTGQEVDLYYTTPIVGANDIMIVTRGISGSTGIIGGTDEETDDAFRTRILNRKGNVPKGGTETDYKNWALEVDGVTRAWTFPEYMGAGTIGVAFVRDNDAVIIPSSTEIATVRAYLVSHTDPNTGDTVGIPITAEPGLFMLELVEKECNFSISITPYDSVDLTLQNLITDEIESYIIEHGGPGETLDLDAILSAILRVDGVTAAEITYPSSDIVAAETEVHIIGDITYSSL